MKIITKLIAISILLSSCNKNEEVHSFNNIILGDWILTERIMSYKNNLLEQDFSSNYTSQFKRDETGVVVKIGFRDTLQWSYTEQEKLFNVRFISNPNFINLIKFQVLKSSDKFIELYSERINVLDSISYKYTINWKLNKL